MAKKLVIVESPAKARTLGRILGSDYNIKASVGHIRDLPKWGLGVDVKKGFTPKYEIPKDKKQIADELRKAAEKASAVYLATDPDREGEAISWHLTEAAGLGDKPVHRVVFHEITEDAIHEAFRHPRAVDMHLVNAQQARRVLDRLVGYKISPLLCRKVRSKLSAGRVQSAALRMIVEREREVQSFVPVEYWTVEAELAKESPESTKFKAKFIGLAPVGGAESKHLDIHTQQEADEITNNLNSASYAVLKVQKKKVNRQPAPPFITSTLQQEAWRKLHFSAKRTMVLAQQLYEGLSIGDEGVVGLITYMRTDSTTVAETALQEARDYISEKFGQDYLPNKPRKFTKKVKGAQEAHEAIRPTKMRREPDSIKQHLSSDQMKLYELIWKRMIASQMAAASFDTTSVDVEAKGKTSYLFRATGSVLRFPGFLTLYSEGKDDAEEHEPDKQPLPLLTEGDALLLIDLISRQHFTQPPPRFNEATLVKAMEEKGIGRPSTYAPTVSTLFDRHYVLRKEGRLYPEDIGMVVNDLLVEHFPNIVNIGFTAQMEEQFDDVSQGKTEWVSLIQDFYTPFDEMLTKANDNMVTLKEPATVTDTECSKCGKFMVIRNGRFGKFLACSGFPKCKNTQPLPGESGDATQEGSDTGDTKASVNEETTDEKCPKCDAPMVIRKGRFGKFLACSGYPKCKQTKPIRGKKDPVETNA